MKDKINLYKIITHNDTEAFGEVYDAYVNNIYRFIVFKVSSREEAEDLTAEVFLKTWQYLTGAQKKEIANIQAFLYRIARNIVVDFYRKKKSNLTLEDISHIPDYRNEIVDLVDLSVEMSVIWTCLDELKEDYKEVIILRYIEDLSVRDISSILGKTSGATRVLLHRAMNTLKKIIEKK